jgi:hypothetical protein
MNEKGGGRQGGKGAKKVQRSANNTRFSTFYLVLPQLLL